MKIYKEVDASNFEFWSGAKDTVKYLTKDEIDTIFDMLDDTGDGMDETEVNDFFWFEDDTIADWLGWPDFETLMEARSGDFDEWHEDFNEWERIQEEKEIDEYMEDEDE